MTVSPMTMVSPPIFLKDAQEVRPMGGVIRTPEAETARSVRGTATLNTPGSLGSSFPLAPVRRSMRAVSRAVPGSSGEAVAAAAAMRAAMKAAFFMFVSYDHLAPIRRSWLEDDPDQARYRDDQGLRGAPEAQEHEERHQRDGHRGRVHERAPSQDEDGSRDGARGRRRHAVHEGLDPAVAREAPEVRRGDHGEDVAGQERGQGGHHRSSRPR